MKEPSVGQYLSESAWLWKTEEDSRSLSYGSGVGGGQAGQLGDSKTVCYFLAVLGLTHL